MWAVKTLDSVTYIAFLFHIEANPGLTKSVSRLTTRWVYFKFSYKTIGRYWYVSILWNKQNIKDEVNFRVIFDKKSGQTKLIQDFVVCILYYPLEIKVLTSFSFIIYISRSMHSLWKHFRLDWGSKFILRVHLPLVR